MDYSYAQAVMPESMPPFFHVTLRLQDLTQGGTNDPYLWKVPIDLEDVLGVKFWNTEIPVE